MMPKSSVVSTSPAPKSSFHMRFTVTRAVSGLSGLTVHFASARPVVRFASRQGRQIVRRIGLHSLRARGVNAARQHIRIGDRRLLPRDERQIAALGELVELRIQLVDLAPQSPCRIDVVEVVTRSPCHSSAFHWLAGLAAHFRNVIFKGRRFASSAVSARRTDECPGSACHARDWRRGIASRAAWAPGSESSPAKRVVHDLGFNRLSIHVDPDPRCLARSVVGKEDVTPMAIERQRINRGNLDLDQRRLVLGRLGLGGFLRLCFRLSSPSSFRRSSWSLSACWAQDLWPSDPPALGIGSLPSWHLLLKRHLQGRFVDARGPSGPGSPARR
jgi:hypothetical protein